MKRKVAALMTCASIFFGLVFPVKAAVPGISCRYHDSDNTLVLTVDVADAAPGTMVTVKITDAEDGYIALKEIETVDSRGELTVALPGPGAYTCKVRRQDTLETAERTFNAAAGMDEALAAGLREAVGKKDIAACETLIAENADALGVQIVEGACALFIAGETAESFSTSAQFAALYAAYAVAAKLNAAEDAETFIAMIRDGVYARALNLDGVLPKAAGKNVYEASSSKIQNAVAQAVAGRNDYTCVKDVQKKAEQEILFQTLSAGDVQAEESVLGAYDSAELLNLDWTAFERLNSTKRRIVLEKIKGTYTNYSQVEQAFSRAVNQAEETTSGGSRPSGNGSSSPITMGINPQTEPKEPQEPAQEPAPQYIFSDMENTKWAVEAVECLYRRGVVRGVNENTYAPERTITRAEFTKMLMSMVNADELAAALPFNDVEPEYWAYPYISKAYASGIVYGITPDQFGGGECVTREQAAVFLERLMSKFEKDKPDPGLNVFIEFDDMEDASEWAKDAIRYLLQITMIKGKENKNFKPKDNLTRAEAAVMFYSYLVVLGKEGR